MRRGVKDDKTCQECKYAVNYLGNLFPKNTSKVQHIRNVPSQERKNWGRGHWDKGPPTQLSEQNETCA